jgi:23S rRNA pseudouridine1911/1915/1917 synthase
VHHDRRRVVDPFDVPARTRGATARKRRLSQTHTVEPAEAGQRIDVAIARLSGASRALVAGAIRDGKILLNGEPVKGSVAIAAGDRIEFTLAERPVLSVEPQALPLSILYEDDDLLVVNKPAGMVTHPAHGTRDGTLVNALLAHAGALPGEPLRAGLVHRLDRDTSGLLVVAKTDAALRSLGKAMMRRFIEREYLGLVSGIPEHAEGTIEGAIGRDTNNRMRYAIRTDGRAAVTHYRVREPLQSASELEFRLETGRTHQIRVHMASFGHPILNDPIYGRRDHRLDLPGQALHAWRLRFRHPTTRADLAFEAPPPEGYVRAKEQLRP